MTSPEQRTHRPMTCVVPPTAFAFLTDPSRRPAGGADPGSMISQSPRESTNETAPFPSWLLDPSQGGKCQSSQGLSAGFSGRTFRRRRSPESIEAAMGLVNTVIEALNEQDPCSQGPDDPIDSLEDGLELDKAKLEAGASGVAVRPYRVLRSRKGRGVRLEEFTLTIPRPVWRSLSRET